MTLNAGMLLTQTGLCCKPVCMKEHLRQLPDIPAVQELARLQAQMQRPALNTNKDGSFELGWGTALLFFGLGSYLSVLLPRSVWSPPWGGWIGYVPLMC